MTATWRTPAAAVIARVILENEGLDEAGLRKKLREAYPFGERKYWPYKVWLSEVKRQLETRFQRTNPNWLVESYDAFKSRGGR